MIEGIIYDPLLEVEMGLSRDLATTKDECKRLRRQVEGAKRMAQTKTKVAERIKAATEQLQAALNATEEFPTMNIQFTLTGGKAADDTFNPFEATVKVLDIQEV